MLKKIYLLLLVTFFLNNCGFSPLYTNQSVSNFQIVNLVMEGDRTINNFFKSNLRQFEKINSDKIFSINIDTKYNKKVLSKDKTGKITEYEISAEVKFQIISEDKLVKELILSERKNMKDISDKFEEQKEENITKQSFASIMSNKLINELSILNDY